MENKQVLNKEPFPHKAYGTCPLGNNFAEAAGGGADEDATGIESPGVELFWYEPLGMYCSKMTIDRLEADEESYVNAERLNQEEIFRSRAGFLNTVPD